MEKKTLNAEFPLLSSLNRARMQPFLIRVTFNNFESDYFRTLRYCLNVLRLLTTLKKTTNQIPGLMICIKQTQPKPVLLYRHRQEMLIKLSSSSPAFSVPPSLNNKIYLQTVIRLCSRGLGYSKFLRI